MKIPIVGAAYRSRSLNMSSDVCINLYPEVSEMDGNVRALYGTPGLRRLCTLPNTGGIRGLFAPAIGKLIAVQGNKVYRVDGNWNITPCPGILLTDTGAVSIAENGTTAVIVDGNNGYTLDLASNVVARINNDAFYGADRVGFIDGYFVFNKPDTQQFYISSLYGTSFDGLDFASAEGAPDLLVSLLVDHREVWMFGETTTEVFYNSGNADFPIERMQGAYLEHGCAAAQSVAKLDNTVFWVGRDSNGNGTVWRANGYTPQRVSTHALEFALQSYSQISDAIAYTYQKDGHAFYVLTFPQASKTWCYDVSTNLWHERAYWNAGNFERHRSNCLAFYGGKHVVGDYENGKLYWLDSDYYMDDDQPLVAQRSTPAINADGKRLFHKSIQIEIEEGVGKAPDFSGLAVETEALVNAMSPKPSNTMIAYLNQAIIELINGGYWDRFDRFGVMQGAEYQQNALVDWINPYKSLALVGSASWNATYGIVGNSTVGSYVRTGYTPSTDASSFTLNRSSVGVYVTQVGSTTLDYLFGWRDSGATNRLELFEGTGDAYEGYACSTSNTYTAGSQTAAALVVLQRTASNNVDIYKNGTEITTGGSTAASVSLPSGELYLVGRNIESGTAGTSTAKIGAWWIGDTFTDAEQIEIKSIIDRYLAAV